ncbi:TadE/TadG family type IV pilus assembly protein [Bacillus tuaregi]|uniref:TadE/TadG family type IV pilus assembly protein n=1 Tax=Bacillus tuaregi TaxID=1816695 RepID=UPI0008F80F23|nr:TadE family protein [Bacillus tuaregi]
MKSEKGQATVELAFSLVILIFFLFAIIDFGRIFHAYLTLEHAGREAARIASIGGTDSDVWIRAKESASTLTIDPRNFSVSPTEQNRKRGTYVTVNISYPVSFSTPLIQSVLPNPLMLQAKTVMRVE